MLHNFPLKIKNFTRYYTNQENYKTGTENI